MVGNPLISVVVNCFNSEKFLDQTLKSVIKQTYQNWEVILWDNQSDIPDRLEWHTQKHNFFLDFSESQLKKLQYAI